MSSDCRLQFAANSHNRLPRIHTVSMFMLSSRKLRHIFPSPNPSISLPLDSREAPAAAGDHGHQSPDPIASSSAADVRVPKSSRSVGNVNGLHHRQRCLVAIPSQRDRRRKPSNGDGRISVRKRGCTRDIQQSVRPALER